MLNQDETHMVLVPIFAWTVCVLTPLRTLKLNQDTVSNISPRLKAYGRVQVLCSPPRAALIPYYTDSLPPDVDAHVLGENLPPAMCRMSRGMR